MDERPSSRAPRPPSTPRWVKVFGIFAAVVVALFLVLLLLGGHEPSRHGTHTEIPLANVAGWTPPTRRDP